MSNSRKKLLESQLKRLSNRRNQLLMKVQKGFKKTRNENHTRRTEDTAEMASQNLQNELAMTIAGEEIREIQQIDHALARISAGKYGVCVSCGCQISMKRLKALPFATLCVECKEMEEKERRPEEEGGFSYGRTGETIHDLDIDAEKEEDIGDHQLEESDTHSSYSNNYPAKGCRGNS